MGVFVLFLLFNVQSDEDGVKISRSCLCMGEMLDIVFDEDGTKCHWCVRTFHSGVT